MTTDAGRPTGDLIVSTALSLFSKIGYEGATMRQIASAVGIQPASLYNHCGSKEELLWSIVQDALEHILTGQRAAFAEGTTANKLRAFMRMHVHFHAVHRQMALVVNNNLPSLSVQHYKTATDQRDLYEHRFRQLLARGCTEGVFHIPNSQIASYALLQMGVGVANWYREDGALTLHEIMDQYEHIALRVVGYADPTEKRSK